MTTFTKTQRDIAPGELVSRQHAIPGDVYKFARLAQFEFTGKPGRGRSNVPTLCDIYQTLTAEGFDLVMNTDWPVAPVFTEIGQPDDCTMARVKFDITFDKKLRELKKRADAGEFNVVAASADARQVSKISLISLAVNLMRVAITARVAIMARKIASQSTISENDTSVPVFVSRETGAAIRRTKRANSAKQ